MLIPSNLFLKYALLSLSPDVSQDIYVMHGQIIIIINIKAQTKKNKIKKTISPFKLLL